MSSPPETDREYAYFRAVGVGDANLIESLMGLSGTEHYNVGDEFQPKDRVYIRKYSSWRLDSGYDDKARLEEHIEALLNMLTPKIEILRQIASEYKLQIVCVSFVYQSFSFELPFEMQKRATNLGISFWFDSYNMGDVHEEVTELRDQLK